MINRTNPRQLSIEEFKLPYAGELLKNNRWVKLAEAMSWEELSEVYNQALSSETGNLVKTHELLFSRLYVTLAILTVYMLLLV